MTTYAKIYRQIYGQIERATDEKDVFYDSEIFEIVRGDARKIGMANIENRPEQNWALAKSNLANLLELALTDGDEFKQGEEGLKYEIYLEIAKRL